MIVNSRTNHVFSLAEDMSQPEESLRGAVFGGNAAAGPRAKRLRTSKNAAGTPTKSPAKEKDQAPAAQVAGAVLPGAGGSNMPPFAPRAPLAVWDVGTEVRTSAIVPSDVRIPVNPQDLEKIPEAFWGTVYESTNYAVSHIYKFTEKELRAIETMSPVGGLESSLDMAMTSVVALHRSIIRTKTQLGDMRDEHQTTLQAAKDALAASQVELEKTRLKVQELKTSLATSRTNLDATKTEVQAAQAALEAERTTSEKSMEDLFYHCWAYNPDADFSFMSASLWERLLVKFQARLDKEAPSEIGDGSGTAERGETVTSKGPPGGA
ncbi:uncharacterized protein LOC133813010 [Humulus lupulus]|uniref:uncharacterized protein LOC133813010 n=1 Tax=Humulus lupulus TaxID=3486 RepID=UPI002B4112B2|nr:uncharacterized protein LOC133813010 [Humulus lupulus]